MVPMRKKPVRRVALLAACLLPLAILAIWPEESLQFIWADTPLYGWLGSLYFGYIVAGFLGVIGIASQAFREWNRSIDWDRFENTQSYRVLKFIEQKFIRLLLLVAIITVAFSEIITMLNLSRQQIGLVIAFLGTIGVAFSMRRDGMYEGEVRDAVERSKKANPGLFEPADVRVVPALFRGGLVLVALGTVLQL